MSNPHWIEWREYVTGILDGEKRPMTAEERAHAAELVKQARQYDRTQQRKQKRLEAGKQWAE